MMLAILWALACFWSVGLTETQYSCEDNRAYRHLKICTILDVYSDELDDAIFPNETKIEFSNSHFHEVGPNIFQLLEGTEELTFRDGFVRSVLFESADLRVLRIINTELTDFDVLGGAPNYSLERLAIRSKVFSRFHPSISQLKGLEILDVAYCNFTYFALDWLLPLSKLRVLDLSNNNLMMLYSGPVLKLNALEELHLASNRLQFVWRFPDAFPNLKMVRFSDNRWLCDWVTMARDSIWILKMISLDADYSCSKGWVLSGGLCCRRAWPRRIKVREDTDIEYSNAPGNSTGIRQEIEESTTSSPDIAFQSVAVDLILIEGTNETEDLAIGVEMGNMTVFVEEPLPVN